MVPRRISTARLQNEVTNSDALGENYTHNLCPDDVYLMCRELLRLRREILKLRKLTNSN